MRKIIYTLLVIIFIVLPFQLYAVINWNEVTLARMFSKDIFELNGIPYLKPMVEALNATSNSRFFNQSFVPHSVDKPYFRISINGMLGFVRDDQKTYVPQLPNEQLDLNKLQKYIKIISPTQVQILDTTGLMYYALKTVLYDGLHSTDPKTHINTPAKAATVLGHLDAVFVLPHGTMEALVKANPAYSLLPASFQQTVINSIDSFPENFTLAPGANINSLIAGIPQIEIGSLWGTELLLRGIPPVDMGVNIGKFAFWGVGLKHSISQYFEHPPLDFAIQAVYQGTHLTNKIGVTNAELTADATFWDVNIQASKHIEGWFDIYTGFSYEKVNISSQYKYALPVETQWQLGLLRGGNTWNGTDSVFVIFPPEPPDYPGDTAIQTAFIRISDSNYKWIIGLAKQLGPVTLFLDYNISKFSIFTFGLEYRF